MVFGVVSETTVNFIAAGLFWVGIIFLQIFLSKQQSRVPGLVLPIMAFFFGLTYPLNMMVPAEGVNAGFLMQMLLTWLLGNTPTIVFVAIYFGCRGKQSRSRQPEKMNIQDLE